MHILISLVLFGVVLLLAGAWYQHAGSTRDGRRFPAPGRLIDIDGTRLHINIQGDGSPPVVFEAGIAATSLSWQLVQPEVARLTQTASYDRAGLGWSGAARTGRVGSSVTARKTEHGGSVARLQSEGAAAPFACWHVVEELRRLLDSAGVASPRILVGHSYGGLVVRAYAARYPREVAGLVLVDPVGALEWSDPAPSSRKMLKLGIRLSRRGALLARLGVPRIAFGLLTGGARNLPKWIARATSGPGAGLIDRLIGQVQKLPRELRPAIQAHWCDPKCFLGMAGYLEALPESAAAVTLAGNAALRDIPLIVLSSANASASERAEHELLAQRSSQGRIEIVSGSGHWIQIDRPDALIGAIGELVSGVVRHTD